MSFNPLILEKLEAEKYLALVLDKAVNDVKCEAIKQAEMIQKGAERLSWYSSCFFDNYKGVCENLSEEDSRFAKALFQLFKGRNAIYDMVEIYINNIFRNISTERINNIQRILVKLGGNISSSSLTSHAFAHAITISICMGFTLRASVDSKLNKTSKSGVLLLGYYGRVQIAAEAARRLKLKNPIFYAGLCNAEIEMLYFIIENFVIDLTNYNLMLMNDREIASIILRMIK